jgi:hypothetical protein
VFGLTARRRSAFAAERDEVAIECIVELWKVTPNDVRVERAQDRFLWLAIDEKAHRGFVARPLDARWWRCSISGQTSKTKSRQRAARRLEQILQKKQLLGHNLSLVSAKISGDSALSTRPSLTAASGRFLALTRNNLADCAFTPLWRRAFLGKRGRPQAPSHDHHVIAQKPT